MGPKYFYGRFFPLGNEIPLLEVVLEEEGKKNAKHTVKQVFHHLQK